MIWTFLKSETSASTPSSGQITKIISGLRAALSKIKYILWSEDDMLIQPTKNTLTIPEQSPSSSEEGKAQECMAVHVLSELHTLMEQGFSFKEAKSLMRLQQWYQDGGSDRAELVRSLLFLRYLLMQKKLEP